MRAKDQQVILPVKPLTIDSKTEWDDVIIELTENITSTSDCEKSLFLDGQWGVGKTTFLNYFSALLLALKFKENSNQPYSLSDIGFDIRELDELPEKLVSAFQKLELSTWDIIPFNPWQLHNKDDPVQTLFDALIAHPKCRQLQVDHLLQNLSSQISYTNENWWSAVLNLLVDPPTTSRIIEKLGKALGNYKLLITIDDLERCPPEYIDRIFRLISLLRPLHKNIRFLIAGNYKFVEHQLQTTLKLSPNGPEEGDVPFMEKLFYTSYLPYDDTIIASYILNFKERTSSSIAKTSQKTTVTALENDCILPFLKVFGIVNRRECKELCQLFFRNHTQFMDTMRGSILLFAYEYRHHKAVITMEKIFLSLLLMKIKDKTVIQRIEANSNYIISNFGFAKPIAEIPIWDDHNLWQGLSMPQREYLAKLLFDLADIIIIPNIDGIVTDPYLERQLPLFINAILKIR